MFAGVAVVMLVVVGIVAVFLAAKRSGRPVPAPQSVTFDSVQGDLSPNAVGETITLQLDQVRNAGIVAEVAGEGVSDSSGTVTGTGIVQADAYKDVKVTALVSGRVKSFLVEPGAKVAKGSVIAVAESEDFVRAQSEFVTARTAMDNAKRAIERSLRLLDINQPGRSDYEMAVHLASSAGASLSEARSRFERAGKMLELGSISREQYESEQAKFRTAEAEYVEAEARLGRAKKLLDVSPEAKSQAESALIELTKAEGDFSAMKEKLRLFGCTESEIDALRAPADIKRELRLRAPVSGILVSRSIASGEVFEKERELFRVADLNELWFVAQVFEKDLSRLKVGSVAEIGVGSSIEDLRGRVTYVDPILNERSRTAQVRIVFRNVREDVRLGTYATLKSVSGLGDGRKVALVKSSALQRIGDADFVFVEKSDAVTFEMRQVRIGVDRGGIVPLIEGVSPGEKVVVDGAFLIRAEFLKRKSN